MAPGTREGAMFPVLRCVCIETLRCYSNSCKLSLHFDATIFATTSIEKEEAVNPFERIIHFVRAVRYQTLVVLIIFWS